MTKWAWDQGHIPYFHFDALKNAASALAEFDGQEWQAGDWLGPRIREKTGLDFAAPSDYTLWRNYARVFRASMLATRRGSKLVCTEIAVRLANSPLGDFGADEYFEHMIRRFSYPSPAFANFSPEGIQVYPFCALLKFLAVRAATTGKYSVTLDEIQTHLIANKITGAENAETYATLKKRSYSPQRDETRQLREFLIFICQVSFLQWCGNEVFLDPLAIAKDGTDSIFRLATPDRMKLPNDRDLALLNLGSLSSSGYSGITFDSPLTSEFDVGFSEGKPIRNQHLRYERSSKLRQIYFSVLQSPYLCDVCSVDFKKRYMWVDNILELHHLLPLSSPVRIASSHTSLEDLVPLCPNCHRAVHVYYRQWLKGMEQDDFISASEARGVYLETKQQFN